VKNVDHLLVRNCLPIGTSVYDVFQIFHSTGRPRRSACDRGILAELAALAGPLHGATVANRWLTGYKVVVVVEKRRKITAVFGESSTNLQRQYTFLRCVISKEAVMEVITHCRNVWFEVKAFLE